MRGHFFDAALVVTDRLGRVAVECGEERRGLAGGEGGAAGGREGWLRCATRSFVGALPARGAFPLPACLPARHCPRRRHSLSKAANTCEKNINGPGALLPDF
ncbi:hypothetical protein GCM10018781_80130 [Kitasatospora indigofera]|uniref:Uncharacterized protein n=1 Tax=Kitasatospora indigofera TaxID=67307 RepID=A0A918YXR1_9ACTN|nr:hypothetical protein GCM10018781_80130 [Kitasatospora indigofera]